MTKDVRATATNAKATPQADPYLDGRISSQENSRGLVQLNVRVPKELKQKVLEERIKRRTNKSGEGDISSIVIDALNSLFRETQ